MAVLRISLFGGVRVAHASGPSEAKVTRTVQGLLAYLLLYRQRAHPREVLAGLFWGDYSEDRARSCLSTTLWRLRSVLEPNGVPRGTYLVATSSGEVGFNHASDHWLDVAVFEGRVAQVVTQPLRTVQTSDVQQLESAVQLYAGDLLEGFNDDWALRERERLRGLYLNSLAYLMRYYRHNGAFEKGLASGQKILQLDPLREEIHRNVMRLYRDSGQRALAARQYETCREILAIELGIQPMEETQALYAQIMGEAGPVHPNSTAIDEPRNSQEALQQVRLAQQDLADAMEQLQRSLQLVEQFMENEDR